MANYYTLLTRESTLDPWAIHFGDYSRRTVQAEASDWCQGVDGPGPDYKIIRTLDAQADIDRRVRALNTPMIEAVAPTPVATMQADCLNTSSCQQIADFARSVVKLNQHHSTMTLREVQAFEGLAVALRTVLALQSK